ncbi:HAD family hydrolase [Streptomyces sp. NPDC017520]|uniref:HAD family hydrolase n=1 Tax=Streptomyces sp. NPDC017520 TaxID=3364998 RepID=UPI0037AF46F5
MTVGIVQASAFLFDLEGVLLDTESIWDEAQHKLLSRRGHTYDRGALKHQLTGLGARQSIGVIIDHYRLPDDPMELLRERREIMIELLRHEIRYIPGALDFVNDSAGVVDMCVATSMDLDLLDVVMTESELQRVFPGPIFTPEDVSGAAKPAPDLFFYAAAELGYAPGDCLVIEDSPIGIEAARAAAIPCIGLSTTHEGHLLSNANLVVSSWAEVPRPSGCRRGKAKSRTPLGTWPAGK